jgi:hypothetical protein
MGKIGRQRRSESAWRDLIERQKDSGLTVPVFCEQEGITPASMAVAVEPRIADRAHGHPHVEQ